VRVRKIPGAPGEDITSPRGAYESGMPPSCPMAVGMGEERKEGKRREGEGRPQHSKMFGTVRTCCVHAEKRNGLYRKEFKLPTQKKWWV